MIIPHPTAAAAAAVILIIVVPPPPPLPPPLSITTRLLEAGASDADALQVLVAPMSDEELLQVGG